MTTTLRQERHVERIGGEQQKFVITNSLLWAEIGSLPHPFVFVYTIRDRSDPKDDTFSRIATLADLTTLPHGRDAGLASEAGVGIEYLAATVVVSYADLETAVAAEKAFKDRMSQLVLDWITYSTGFVASPVAENILLPLVSTTTKKALIDAYRTAKQNRYAAQQAANAAANAWAAAQANTDAVAADVMTLQAIASAAAAAATSLASAVSNLATLRAAANSFLLAAASAPEAAKTTMSNAIAAAQIAEGGLAQRSSEASAAGSAANAALASKQATATSSWAVLTAANATKLTTQQQLSEAQAAEAAALAALLAVCPDFDPTTICNVPG